VLDRVGVRVPPIARNYELPDRTGDRGGIGGCAGLRCQYLTVWGFESPRSHKSQSPDRSQRSWWNWLMRWSWVPVLNRVGVRVHLIARNKMVRRSWWNWLMGWSWLPVLNRVGVRVPPDRTKR